MREDIVHKIFTLISYDAMNNVLKNGRPMIRTKMRKIKVNYNTL